MAYVRELKDTPQQIGSHPMTREPIYETIEQVVQRQALEKQKHEQYLLEEAAAREAAASERNRLTAVDALDPVSYALRRGGGAIMDSMAEMSPEQHGQMAVESLMSPVAAVSHGAKQGLGAGLRGLTNQLKNVPQQLSLLDELTAAAPAQSPLAFVSGKVPVKGGGGSASSLRIPQSASIEAAGAREALAAEREVLALADAAKARRAAAAETAAMNRAAQARNAGKVPAVWDEATEMARVNSIEAAKEALKLKRAADQLQKAGQHQEAAELHRIAAQLEDAIEGVARGPASTKLPKIPETRQLAAPSDTIKNLKAAVRGQGKKLPSRPKGMGEEEYKELLRQATVNSPTGRGPELSFKARPASAEWAAEYKTARDAFRANIVKTFAAVGGTAASAAVVLNSLMDGDEDDDDGSELPFGSRQHAEALDEFRGADAGDVEDPMMVNKETVPGRASPLIPQLEGMVRADPVSLPGPKLPKNKKKRNQLFVAQEHRDRVSNLYLNAPHGERVSLEELHVQVPSNVKYKEALYKKAFYTGGVVTHHPNSPNSYIVVDPKTWKPTVYGPGDAARANADWRKRKNEQNILADPDRYRRKLVGRGRKNMSLAKEDAINSGDRKFALMLHYNTRDEEDPRIRLAMGDFNKSDPIIERNFYGRGRRGISTRRGGTSIDRDAYLKYQQEYNDRFDKDRELTPEEVLIKGWTRQGDAYKAEMSEINSRLAGLEALGAAAMETEQYKGLLTEREELQKLGLENQTKFSNLNLREERPGGFLEEFLPPEARLLPEYREGATVGQYGGATLLPPRAEKRRKRLHDMMQPYFKEELADENKRDRLKIPREFSTGVYGIDYAPKPGSDLPASKDKGDVAVPLQVTEGAKKVTITNRNVFEHADNIGKESSIPKAVANVQALVEYVKSNPDAINEIESSIPAGGTWKSFINGKMDEILTNKKGNQKTLKVHDIPELNDALNELYMLGIGREEIHPRNAPLDANRSKRESMTPEEREAMDIRNEKEWQRFRAEARRRGADFPEQNWKEFDAQWNR